jgi:hypothetical protein
MDGFEKIALSKLETGSAFNVEPYRNEFSPFSHVDRVKPVKSGDDVFVDSYYGLAYDEWICSGGAPYGITDLMQAGPLDNMAKSYLRVPFARIPCIEVNEKKDILQVLEKIKEAYPGLTLLFRGQNQEHLLNRNAETLELLYGGHVREPSLLASAERKKVNIDAVGPVWCGLLRRILDIWSTQNKDNSKFRSVHKFGEHYLFHRFALAMAQHYGLPSNGLDVTNSIEVALFFALHCFSISQTKPNSQVCSRLSNEGSIPVLYIFATETDLQYIRFENNVLDGLPENRPTQQSAFFLQRSWGFARNRSARNLVAALFLHPNGDYGKLPQTENLFPGADKDIFGITLETSLPYLPDLLPEFDKFIQYFAWVYTSS